MGRSIGTGPSTFLASRAPELIGRHIGGICIVSPFSSFIELAVDLAGSIANLLAPHLWDNSASIAAATPGTPVCIIHGVADDLIAFKHGEKVFQAARCDEPRKMLYLSPTATHRDFHFDKDFILPLHKFFSQVLHTSIYKPTPAVRALYIMHPNHELVNHEAPPPIIKYENEEQLTQRSSLSCEVVSNDTLSRSPSLVPIKATPRNTGDFSLSSISTYDKQTTQNIQKVEYIENDTRNNLTSARNFVVDGRLQRASTPNTLSTNQEVKLLPPGSSLIVQEEKHSQFRRMSWPALPNTSSSRIVGRIEAVNASAEDDDLTQIGNISPLFAGSPISKQNFKAVKKDSEEEFMDHRIDTEGIMVEDLESISRPIVTSILNEIVHEDSIETTKNDAISDNNAPIPIIQLTPTNGNTTIHNGGSSDHSIFASQHIQITPIKLNSSKNYSSNTNLMGTGESFFASKKPSVLSCLEPSNTILMKSGNHTISLQKISVSPSGSANLKQSSDFFHLSNSSVLRQTGDIDKRKDDIISGDNVAVSQTSNDAIHKVSKSDITTINGDKTAPSFVDIDGNIHYLQQALAPQDIQNAVGNDDKSFKHDNVDGGITSMKPVPIFDAMTEKAWEEKVRSDCGLLSSSSKARRSVHQNNLILDSGLKDDDNIKIIEESNLSSTIKEHRTKNHSDSISVNNSKGETLPSELIIVAQTPNQQHQNPNNNKNHNTGMIENQFTSSSDNTRPLSQPPLSSIASEDIQSFSSTQNPSSSKSDFLLNGGGSNYSPNARMAREIILNQNTLPSAAQKLPFSQKSFDLIVDPKTPHQLSNEITSKNDNESKTMNNFNSPSSSASITANEKIKSALSNAVIGFYAAPPLSCATDLQPNPSAKSPHIIHPTQINYQSGINKSQSNLCDSTAANINNPSCDSESTQLVNSSVPSSHAIAPPIFIEDPLVIAQQKSENIEKIQTKNVKPQASEPPVVQRASLFPADEVAKMVKQNTQTILTSDNLGSSSATIGDQIMMSSSKRVVVPTLNLLGVSSNNYNTLGNSGVAVSNNDLSTKKDAQDDEKKNISSSVSFSSSLSISSDDRLILSKQKVLVDKENNNKIIFVDASLSSSSCSSLNNTGNTKKTYNDDSVLMKQENTQNNEDNLNDTIKRIEYNFNNNNNLNPEKHNNNINNTDQLQNSQPHQHSTNFPITSSVTPAQISSSATPNNNLLITPSSQFGTLLPPPIFSPRRGTLPSPLLANPFQYQSIPSNSNNNNNNINLSSESYRSPIVPSRSTTAATILPPPLSARRSMNPSAIVSSNNAENQTATITGSNLEQQQHAGFIRAPTPLTARSDHYHNHLLSNQPLSFANSISPTRLPPPPPPASSTAQRIIPPMMQSSSSSPNQKVVNNVARLCTTPALIGGGGGSIYSNSSPHIVSSNLVKTTKTEEAGIEPRGHHLLTTMHNLQMSPMSPSSTSSNSSSMTSPAFQSSPSQEIHSNPSAGFFSPRVMAGNNQILNAHQNNVFFNNGGGAIYAYPSIQSARGSSSAVHSNSESNFNLIKQQHASLPQQRQLYSSPQPYLRLSENFANPLNTIRQPSSQFGRGSINAISPPSRILSPPSTARESNSSFRNSTNHVPGSPVRAFHPSNTQPIYNEAGIDHNSPTKFGDHDTTFNPNLNDDNPKKQPSVLLQNAGVKTSIPANVKISTDGNGDTAPTHSEIMGGSPKRGNYIAFPPHM